ncbi:uncharacterized protein LOC115927504 [Strongylocentrotus purpuratus]|uniref:Fibronectin type-III domain-containing protein n=1 Tax=Strongylocentrotus purpuratus TaxID=7668 RepID=A0A7M7PCY5_STRPU|nr:uncharacterized protein LOC115927504 [Strongylocentrotus purpuratus]
MWQMKCVFWHAIRYGTLYTVIAVLSVLLYSCREKSNPTLPKVLPRLSYPPKATAIGTSYAVVRWYEQHSGDGPICAYAIDRRRLDKNNPSWLTAVFVSEQSGSQSREELVFNMTGLESDTGYQVSVRPILCDGARVSELGEGPTLSLTTLSIVLPTLMEAPQSTNLSSTHVSIRWTNQHQGDGPICGYGINIKKNDDKDRDDDDSDPWRSVGYVSVESELLYDVGHLEANTTYQVAVSPINCISARESPREPILQFTTKPVTIPVVVLPRLSHPPNVKSIGTSYAVVQWQEQHTGDGPICAYAIDRRSLGEDVPSWLSVGFVSEQSGSLSKEELVFNITGLEPETDYQVSVRPILCDGARASKLGEGPILYLTTPSIEVVTTEPLITEPQKTEPKRVPISEASFCTKPKCTVVVILLILGYYLTMREE